MENQEVSKNFQKILNKIASYIGKRTFPKKYLNDKDGWRHKHTWSLEDMEECIEWTTKFLMKNKEARYEIVIGDKRELEDEKHIAIASEHIIKAAGWDLDRESAMKIYGMMLDGVSKENEKKV